MIITKTTSSYSRPRKRTLELGTQVLVVYIFELAESTVERRVLNLTWKRTEARVGICAGGGRLAHPSSSPGFGSTTTVWEAEEQDFLGSI